MFSTVKSASSIEHPTLTTADCRQGGMGTVQVKTLKLNKRLNRSFYIPGSGKKRNHLNTLIVGDSYADDVDMGYTCWPTRLARRRGGSFINAAVGGSRACHGVEQLREAKRLSCEVGSGAALTADTLTVLHLGGNDLLHSLALPWMLLLLVLDFARLLLRWAGGEQLGAHLAGCMIVGQPRPASLGSSLSFFGQLSARISRHLCEALDAVAAETGGAGRVVLCTLPVCESVPIARLVISSLTLGLASPNFVSGVIGYAARLVHAEGVESAAAYARSRHPGMRVLVFDEAGEIAALARRTGQTETRLREVVRLVWQRLRGAADLTGFWRDADHPSPWVHEQLAARADELVRGTI